jgi:hypothetical protein
MLGCCIFCFVLFASCKSLSSKTPLWHGNDNEKVGASLHEFLIEQYILLFFCFLSKAIKKNQAKRELESGKEGR